MEEEDLWRWVMPMFYVAAAIPILGGAGIYFYDVVFLGRWEDEEGEDGMRGGAVAGEMSGAEIGIGMGPGAEAETTGTTGEPGTGAGGGVVVGAGAGKGRESDGLGRKRSVVGSTEPVRQGWLDICHAISQLKRPSVIVEGKVYPSHLL